MKKKTTAPATVTRSTARSTARVATRTAPTRVTTRSKPRSAPVAARASAKRPVAKGSARPGKSVASAQRRELYPPIEPFKQGYLRVSEIHEIYYEESGNPAGKPALFLRSPALPHRRVRSARLRA
jgi:hypothetical protein